jgi:lysozyme family protein
MADFALAYAKVAQLEGGYVDHPSDRGGETWRGVARVSNPHWPGWPLIDAAKADPTFPRNLASLPGLQERVDSLYRERYWEPIAGDTLPQELADRLFDVAVNQGTRRAVIFLQVALTVLNRNGTLWPDLRTDGVLGEKSIEALAKALALDEGVRLAHAVRFQSGARHIEIALQNPSQRAFIRGWLARDAA